ncbi:MAG: tRNA(Ile)-lysidine synthetase, partial [Thermoleophilia bacterium]|nr:tRNA(Ile)-lysidine synthetase [Thermoleophilia bacterium]
MAPTEVAAPSAVRRIRRMLDDAGIPLTNRRLLALCSGGVDSVVLVDLLAQLPHGAAPRSIDVLWLDHGIRADSDRECAAARAVAERHGLALHVARRSAEEAEADRAAGAGTQAAARAWRLATAIEQARRIGADVIATGHTASDQLEGSLLDLVGVTGPGALRPMRMSRSLASGVELVRPLLGLGRDAVVACARTRELEWVEDPSNADTSRYARNAMRHDVVPLLLAAHPDAGVALARAAAREHEGADATSGLATALLHAWGVEPATDAASQLDLRRLAELPAPARRALLAAWLAPALGR